MPRAWPLGPTLERGLGLDRIPLTGPRLVRRASAREGGRVLPALPAWAASDLSLLPLEGWTPAPQP